MQKDQREKLLSNITVPTKTLEISPVAPKTSDLMSLCKIQWSKSLLISSPDAKFHPPGNNTFDRLPLDMKIHILSFLTVKELLQAAHVSKHWNYLTSLNVIWSRFDPGYKRTYVEPAQQSYRLKHSFFQVQHPEVVSDNCQYVSWQHQHEGDTENKPRIKP